MFGKSLTLLLVLVLMSACDPGGQPGTETGLPKRNPVQPPATQPVKPKTPGPIAGDPNPHDKRSVYLRVACAPLDEYVEIEWQAGPAQGGHVREKKCFPAWEKTVEVWSPAAITLTARWTEISYRDLARKNTTGSIDLLIKVDDTIKCDKITLNGSRGVTCPTVRV